MDSVMSQLIVWVANA